MTAPESIRRIADKIAASRDAMVELQSGLVAIPALSPVNGGEGEGKKAAFLVNYLRGAGFTDILELPAPDPDCPGGRPNIVVRAKGNNPDRTVWIMSHLDVVPPGDLSLWTGDPWTLRVDGDRIIGRGTEDNHQGVVASIFAARAFIELDEVPASNIGLLFVADEENGSKWGIEWILENHGGLFKKDDWIIVPDAGNPDGTMIEVAEKSLIWIRFSIKGKQVHASTPEKGINAHLAGCHLITRLYEALHRRFDRQDLVFDPPISTFEPTKKDANVLNVNSIPGEDIFYFDCRVLPSYQAADVLQAIRGECDAVESAYKVGVSLEILQGDQAAPATPVDAPVVVALQEALRDIHGVEGKPMGIGGGTVAAVFRRAGFHAAVWSTVDDAAHEPDEFCRISNMVRDAQVFAHAFMAGE
jgi:succinyl-diaminopimelate desuccinylase